MPYLNLDCGQIYYESRGNGIPLVLIHGVGGNHASWFNQVERFSPEYRVITIDLPGFGNSEDRGSHGKAGFVQAVKGVLARLVDQPAIMVGQSMGAGVAINYARMYGEGVRGLCIANSLVGLRLPPDLLGELESIHSALADAAQHTRVLGKSSLREQPHLRYLYEAIASFNYYTFNTIVGTEETISVIELDQLNIPTLFIAAGEDVLFPSEIILEVVKMSRRFDACVIRDAGHSSYLEKPREFNAALSRWLENGLSI